MSYSENEVETTGQGPSEHEQTCNGAQHTGLLQRTANSLLALGNRVKDWYSNHSTQGYLPNLHIDE